MIKVRARVADLISYDDCWCENGSWAKEIELEFEDGVSDLAMSRRIKKELGITGMRKDYWGGPDFSWRDGSVGAYAYVTH